MQYKKCTSLHHIGDRKVPINKFSKHKSSRDGRQGTCGACMTVAQQKYRNKNKRDHPERYLFERVRGAAKSANREFSLILEDIIIPKKCPILGIALFFTDGTFNDNTPSLDRINNNKGYVRGNVHVISYRANYLKGNGVPEEHRLIYEYFRDGGVLDSIPKYGISHYDKGTIKYG